MATKLKALAIVACVLARGAAHAETRDLCAALPRAEAEQALKLRAFGPDQLDDRLGAYRRQMCRLQTEPGETIELVVWSRQDGRPFAPLPARAEQCDVGCLAFGREPNLYRYEQKRIAGALCVTRLPRADRDLDTGPVTACTIGGPRRVMFSVARKHGLAAAPMETVKSLLDRAASALRSSTAKDHQGTKTPSELDALRALLNLGALASWWSVLASSDGAVEASYFPS